MRLPRIFVDPFQAIACRIGRIGTIPLHAPLWKEPGYRNTITSSVEAFLRADVCRYCRTPLNTIPDRTGSPYA